MHVQSRGALNIAHGGALDPSRANSLEGICDSISFGADAIEVDVQVTRDGQPVLFHDSALFAQARKTRISDLTFSELAAIDAAEHGRRIPLLKDVLDRLRDTKIQVLLDVKARGAIDDVMRVIREAHAEDKLWIASFDYSPLTRAKQLQAGIPTALTVGISRVMASPLGFLWTLFALLFPLVAATRVRAAVILCPAYRLSRRLVRRAHRKQISVFVWKLKDRAAIRQLQDYNVDGLVTDWPAAMAREGDA